MSSNEDELQKRGKNLILASFKLPFLHFYSILKILSKSVLGHKKTLLKSSAFFM